MREVGLDFGGGDLNTVPPTVSRPRSPTLHRQPTSHNKRVGDTPHTCSGAAHQVGWNTKRDSKEKCSRRLNAQNPNRAKNKNRA